MLKRKYSPDQLSALVARGLNLREIGLELGISRERVRQVLKVAGIVSPVELRRREVLRKAALALTVFHPCSKVCPSCGEVKFLGEFSPDPSGTLGRHGWCKACMAARMKERYRSDPDFREHHLRWMRENPEKCRSYERKWRLGHGEEKLKRIRERYASDPVYREKVLARNREYQRRKKESK
jgi:hypothetical protein